MPGKNSRYSESYIKKTEQLDLDIVKKIINSFNSNSKERLALNLMIQTGCTPNEIINLKQKDLDPKSCKITLDSGRKKRTIKIQQKLNNQIQNFLNKNKTFVFYSKNNSNLTKRTIHRILEKASKNIGIKITTHNLRELYIQQELEGKSLNEVKENLKLKRLDVKKFITKNDFLKIKHAITNYRDELIFDILFETGCLLKELILIKVKNIDLANSELIINKKNALNKISRKAKFSYKLKNKIKEFINQEKLTSENFLFSTRQSDRITEERVFQIINHYSLKSGFKKINSQILRYSHIVDSFNQGKKISELKFEMGIKNLDKFHLYGNLFVK